MRWAVLSRLLSCWLPGLLISGVAGGAFAGEWKMNAGTGELQYVTNRNQVTHRFPIDTRVVNFAGTEKEVFHHNGYRIFRIDVETGRQTELSFHYRYGRPAHIVHLDFDPAKGYLFTLDDIGTVHRLEIKNGAVAEKDVHRMVFRRKLFGSTTRREYGAMEEFNEFRSVTSNGRSYLIFPSTVTEARELPDSDRLEHVWSGTEYSVYDGETGRFVQRVRYPGQLRHEIPLNEVLPPPPLQQIPVGTCLREVFVY